MAFKLRYGNTNTFFLRGSGGNLLIDTDYAGTLPAFYKAIKAQNIRMEDVTYLLATHYHPDHIGLAGVLMKQGVKLLLLESQRPHVHFADPIFSREGRTDYEPIDADAATVITCGESRAFLKNIGLNGEIVPTTSHSADGIALILDDGSCFVGDLEPIEYLEAYEENSALKADWERILRHEPKVIYYAHAPEKKR